MNVNFPIGKEKINSIKLILHNDHLCSVIATDANLLNRHYQICRKVVTIRESQWNGDYKNDKERKIQTETEGDSVVKAIFYFFLEYKNSVDCLQLDTLLVPNGSKEEDPTLLPRIKRIIDNRPISTVFFVQDCYPTNNPTALFFREYVDYKMYLTDFDSGDAIEINDKMVNCEFLGLKCRVTNAERLKEFKGWGLALHDAEEKGFNFQFFYKVVQDWYSGKDLQYRYLLLECSINESWNDLTSLGGEGITEKRTTEYEIKRSDGATCRILKGDNHRDGNQKTYVGFYLGEKTTNITRFNIFWDFRWP